MSETPSIWGWLPVCSFVSFLTFLVCHVRLFSSLLRDYCHASVFSIFILNCWVHTSVIQGWEGLFIWSWTILTSWTSFWRLVRTKVHFFIMLLMQAHPNSWFTNVGPSYQLSTLQLAGLSMQRERGCLVPTSDMRVCLYDLSSPYERALRLSYAQGWPVEDIIR